MDKTKVSSHTRKTPSGELASVSEHLRSQTIKEEETPTKKTIQAAKKSHLLQLDEESLRASADVFILDTNRQLFGRTSDVKNVLLTMKKMLDNLLSEIPEEERGEIDSDDILFALNPETSRWSSHGFGSEDDWETWESLQVPPEEAELWKNMNVSVMEASIWRDVGPAEYKSWKDAGASPHEAAQWKYAKFTPEEFKFCVAHNIHRYEAVSIRNIGPLQDMVKIMKDNRIDSGAVRRWLNQDIPINHITAWIQKGYTPGKAAKLQEKNITPEKAKDLRNGAPVPGTSWKKLTKITKENGWTVGEAIPLRQNQVCFKLTKNGQSECYMHFTSTGRFLKLTFKPGGYGHITKRIEDTQNWLTR